MTLRSKVSVCGKFCPTVRTKTMNKIRLWQDMGWNKLAVSGLFIVVAIIPFGNMFNV